MGRNNQQRRADKKRRQNRRPSGPRGRPSDSPRWGPFDDGAWRVELLTITGAQAAADGAPDEMQATAAVLVRCAESMGSAAVATSIGKAFCSILASMWEGGWQPAEIARQVRRRRSARHGEVVAAAMGAQGSWVKAAGAPMPEAWAVQLADHGVAAVASSSPDWLGTWAEHDRVPFDAAVAAALETLGVLLPLPAIEALLPRPTEWAGLGPVLGRLAADDPILAKIRALLAKAESTGFEAESEALTAKAQELMSRHAIDDALTRAERCAEERPAVRRLAVDDPYAAARSRLLQVVADASSVRCVWYEDLAMMALIGFDADLDAVELLFTSLLVQGSRAMLAKGSITDGRGRSRTRSFRQSFLIAYAGRIGERLALAALQARREAEKELATSLLPVLAGRDQEVDDAVTTAFPHLKAMAGPAVTNEAGWRAGRTAAELATLGPEQEMMTAG